MVTARALVPVSAPHGEVPVSWILHEGPGFRLGFARLPLNHPRWRRTNVSSGPFRDGSTVVSFARHAMRLDAGGRHTVDAMTALRLPAFLEYRRTALDPRGDATDCLLLSEELSEAHFGSRPRSIERLNPGPIVLPMRLLVARLRAGNADPLAVEEDVHRILAAVGRGPSLETGRHRRDVVEDAKAALATKALERAPLRDLARHLDVTPAHLVRAFRRGTGETLHAYRDALRLARGLESLEEGDESLAQAGLAAGFSSHAHFSRRFRARFGAPPSAVRGQFAAAGRLAAPLSSRP